MGANTAGAAVDSIHIAHGAQKKRLKRPHLYKIYSINERVRALLLVTDAADLTASEIWLSGGRTLNSDQIDFPSVCCLAHLFPRSEVYSQTICSDVE